MTKLKSFSKRAHLKCIYCGEDQGAPAIDFIPYILNIYGRGKPQHSSEVTSEQCGDCDQVFYKCLFQNRIFVANLPSKLHDMVNEENAITAKM